MNRISSVYQVSIMLTFQIPNKQRTTHTAAHQQCDQDVHAGPDLATAAVEPATHPPAAVEAKLIAPCLVELANPV